MLNFSDAKFLSITMKLSFIEILRQERNTELHVVSIGRQSFTIIQLVHNVYCAHMAYARLKSHSFMYINTELKNSIMITKIIHYSKRK
jgi:hypothetical protein